MLHDGKVSETHDGDPLAFIEQYQARFKVALRPGMPRFCGGLAGYFGYDTVRHIEPCLGPAVKPFPAGMEGGTPDLMLMHVDELVIVDNLAGRIYLMVYADPAQPRPTAAPSSACTTCARGRRRWKSRTATPACRPRNGVISRRKTIWRPCTAPGTHRRRRSDAGPGRTSHRQALPRFALSLYRALRSSIPPLHVLLELRRLPGRGRLAEILVRQERIVDNGVPKSQITIRPLAGTRKRGATPEEDAALAAELKADPRKWPSTSC